MRALRNPRGFWVTARPGPGGAPSLGPQKHRHPHRGSYQGRVLHHVVDIRGVLRVLLGVHIDLHGLHGPLQHGTSSARAGECPGRVRGPHCALSPAPLVLRTRLQPQPLRRAPRGTSGTSGSRRGARADSNRPSAERGSPDGPYTFPATVLMQLPPSHREDAGSTATREQPEQPAQPCGLVPPRARRRPRPGGSWGAGGERPPAGWLAGWLSRAPVLDGTS